MNLTNFIVILITLIVKCIKCDHGFATNDAIMDTWEDVQLICPNQCVCNQSPFMDLSIARWIQGLKLDKSTGSRREHKKSNEATDNENETYFDDDSSHLDNVYTKCVMCMLQGDGNFKELAVALPPDLQALVLLHNSNANSNYTILSSDLLQFNGLTTLEIRGTGSNRNLNFFIDEPLMNLKHANFESIELMADERLAKMHSKNPHPSETYSYMPESERFTYNVSLEMTEEIEIVSYDVYRMELERSKQATFIGWINLEVLRIHNCQFDEIYWELFDSLVNLRHLSLEHNEIKIIPAFAFYGALHIKTLSLARNNILDLHYRALAGLLDLEYLDLSSNNLTKLSEITFPPFPSLKIVDLRQNPIQFIFPMTFGIMNGTAELTIGSDAMALDLSIGGGSFLALDRLEHLNLLNVSTPQLTQTMFTGLKNLKRLKLKGSINRIEYDAFAEMPKLHELILSDCDLFELSMDAFFGIKDLRVIDLSNNHLFLIPPGLFDEQKQLQEIYLQRNELSNLPHRFFDNPSVKLIRLTENPWICSCEMVDWKQAVTNHVRSKRLSSQSDNRCYINPKTGKLESCDERMINDYPKYSYDFDNKLSPRCDGGPKDVKHRSVYYTLRRNIKCSQSTSKVQVTSKSVKLSAHLLEKKRIQTKHTVIVDKIAHMQKYLRENNAKMEKELNKIPMEKSKRIQSIDDKIRRTVQQNAKRQKLKSQVITNLIAN